MDFPARCCFARVIAGCSTTFALSTVESESGGCCWLHPGVSPPGDAVRLDDESISVLESGCMFSSKLAAFKNG